MTWLAVKTFFKKAWAWVVKYWQYFALACYTVIVYTLLRKNKNTDGAITFVGNTSPNDGLFTSPQFSISPKVGDIFIFPSTLRHQVYPFRTENGQEIRKSLSFNIWERKTYL